VVVGLVLPPLFVRHRDSLTERLRA
jgi:hypothetical protein